MIKPLRALIVVLLPASAAQANEALLEHLGGQGCVIGPGSAEIAQTAGFDPDDLEPLRAKGQMQGDWHSLPPEMCTIRLPQITSMLTIEDARPYLSAFDEYAEFGDAGCFLKTDLLDKALINKGWSKDDAFWGYITLVGKGVIDGDWAFYSDNPMRTPPGFQYLGGACGEVEGVDNTRANHAFLATAFGEYIRQSAPVIPCESGEILMHPGWPAIIETLTDGQNTNAWVAFEMSIIAMAAGWYDGMSATEKGTPRPPVCHYP